MPTPFEEIYDLALVSFKDWRLDKLFSSDPNSFYLTMQSYMIKAIPNFTNPNVSLYEYDLVLKQFNNTLDLDTKVILSNFLVLSWFEYQLNDTREISVLLNDNDFSIRNQNTVIKEKADLRDKFREQNERALLNYSLKNVDWSKLVNGDYYNL